jgi:hypothetical protein
MSLDEPKEAIKTAILDRISHPVMGVFLLALAVCNWKPVAFLVISDTSAAERIKAAETYVTWQTGLFIPLAITAGWVLLGPILKVLALMYDRYVSNWEKVRAYKAALQVVERNTAEASAALKQLEEQLAGKRTEFAETAAKAELKQEELRKATELWDAIAKVGSQGWQSAFVGGGAFPYQAGTEAYAKAKSRFDLLDRFKMQVLGSGN